MMLHTKYQDTRPCGFKQEDFFMFLPIKDYVKPVTPEALPFLAQGRGPRAIISTNLVEVHLMILHTKTQSARPCGFRQEDFLMLLHIAISLCKTCDPPLGQAIFHVSPYKRLCKTCDPRGGTIFGPRAIISTNLVEVH